MAQDGFRWKKGGAPPQIASHSNAKLDLLSGYLDRYFKTISVNPQIDRISISLIDGFSGGGLFLRDGNERPGSPFVLLKAVEQAQVFHNIGRRKPLTFDAKFYFVDSDRDAIAFLHSSLMDRGYGEQIASGRICLFAGAFESKSDEIISDIRLRQRGGRSLFILDQKGWSAVQFLTIKKILGSLTKAEVILTFAVDWLVSYLSEDPSFALAAERIGIDSHRVKEYLIAKGLPGFQYIIPRMLVHDIKLKTGAPFFTPFFLRSRAANRDLWIIHLSKLVTARNVMVESHWTVGNASLHRGPAGMDMLGFDPHWEDGCSFDFGFDQNANTNILESMINEMPYKVEQLEKSGRSTVSDFIEAFANDTAARRSQFEEAMTSLQIEKQLEIFNSDGSPRRLGVRPQLSDHVRLSRQLLIPGLRIG